MSEEVLYKLTTAADWSTAQAAGEVAWSAIDRRDGFMHLSTAAQVLETARLHYAGAGDLVALEIPRSEIDAGVKFELAPKRGEMFPHYYGRLAAASVSRARPLAQQTDGSFRFAGEEGA
ncbi:MAG: DUF952 domain-containing protein [Pseudomonadota bacterium]|nr:DUF952 domain-containing protein [Pseudomonadota bacterium]